MATKPTVFSREIVGGAALDLVRELGWQALSARTVASRLGSSVGPIYSAFTSMEGLQSFVLDEATNILDACIARAGSGKRFLDMGIGLAIFARDEPLLYRALLENGGSTGRLEGYKQELLARFSTDGSWSFVDQKYRARLFERMWLFSLGLASALVHGYATDTSDEELAALLDSQGSIVIYGEIAGLGDVDGPACKKAWSALMKRKGKHEQD